MMRSSKAQASSNPSVRVRVYWGDILYDTVVCEPKRPMTIGRLPSSTIVMDLGKGHSHAELPLVTLDATRTNAELRFDKATEGHVRFNGKLVTLEKAREDKATPTDEKGFHYVKLTDKDKASIVVGYVSFDIDWVKQSEVIERPLISDKRFAVVASALMAFAVLMLSVLEVPKVEEPEKEKPPERIVEIIPPKEIIHAKAAQGERKSADGGAAKGDPGKAAVAPPKAEEKPSAAQTLKSANLGSLANSLSAITSNSAPAADSKVKAAAAQAQAGTGGFSTEGLKTGGGGKSTGIGRTVGQGEGGFEGTGKLGLSGNSLVDGSTGRGVNAPLQQTGGLDRAVIDQIVRRRQDRIRLCYERQLNFAPKLAGKVTVHFTIGKEGEVLKTNIVEDTMKNQAVRDCISSEVKTWTFPRPSGGTLVEVDYPFVFESGGGG